MKSHTTIDPLYMSFYSRSLYEDVGRNWRGTSLLYLVLLLAVSLIPLTFKVHAEVSDFVNREAPKYVTQVPVITISNGRVSIREPMPYVIKDPDNKPFFIIDTTGQVTSLRDSAAAALLTERELLIKSGRGSRSLDLSEIDNLVVDQGRLYSWTETLLSLSMFVLYPTALFFSFLFRLAQALIFGVIGMLYARNMKVTLPYQSAVSLAIVSMTPSIILGTLYDYVGITIPFWWLVNFLIGLGYLIFAVRSNAVRTDGG